MSMGPDKPSTWQRIQYAVTGIEGSGWVKGWAFITAVGAFDKIFKIQKQLVEGGIMNENIPTAGLVVWIVFSVLAAHSVFCIGEQAGRLRERNHQLEKLIEAHEAAHSCVHSVIHQTRDSLFAHGEFNRLLRMPDGEKQAHLYQIIEAQLGVLERAMEKLSGAECCVMLKIRQEGVLNGKAGLVSVCYGTILPERRNNSTILPVDRGIAQEVLATKQIVYTNDILTDPRFHPQDQRQQFAARYRSVAASPIKINGDVVAVLCFDWKEPNMFKENYKQLLACFTDTISAGFYVVEVTRNTNNTQQS